MDISSFNKEDLAKLVFTDELTNLYNRRFFYQYLNDKVNWKDHSGGFSLLMIDIDFFKKINDTYGHLEGDNVLRQLGAVLKETLGDKGIAIRYAGDEFSAILPAVDKKKSLALAEAMLKRVSGTKFQQRNAKAEPLNVNISIGIASFPEDAQSPQDLIEQADKALYLSKREGRNRASIAGSFSDEDVLERNIFLNFPCPDFVARQDFYHEIVRFLTPDQEANTFILVEGSVGAGKTRLLRELSGYSAGGGSALGGKDALIFYNICNEIDSVIPYRPIITFINSLAESNNSILAEACKELAKDMLLEINRIVPNISRFIPSFNDFSYQGAGQNRKLLFDSLVMLFNLLSQKKPLMFLLDEAQNIDHATLLVVEALTEKEKGCSVIVAAVRDDYLNISQSANEVFNQFLSTISERQNYRRFSLPLFNKEQTAEIVSTIFSRKFPDQTFYDKLHQVTRGNPLFIEELLKHLLLKDFIKRVNKQWFLDLPAIPPAVWQKNLDTIIAENIDLLEAETKTVIKQAAVVPTNVGIDVLKDVAHQNEGETIDALDKAKRLNIIKPTEPLKQDQFTFTTKHFQEIVYQNIEEKERETLHQAVGDATEKLYQDKLDSVAPALAFHFAKAGDEAKAQMYGQKAENITANLFRKDEIPEYYSSLQGIVQSRIKEALQPLSPQKMALVKDLLRNLLSTSKNMRLYPDGSQLIVMASGGLVRIMNSIFDETKTFTLSEAKNALNINTTPLDAKTYGSAVDEFLSLLKEHYIKSITFRRGVTEQEIERILKNLDRSPDKPFAAKGYWNQFLDDKGIANIGIAQRSFIAAKERGISSAIPTAQEKVELEGPLVGALKDFFRFFCAAVENIKLYPPGSQLALEAVRFVTQSIDNVFGYLSVLNLSVSDEILLVNGTPGHPRLLGTASTTLAKLIRDYQLKSISFIRGASKEELEHFISVLSGTPLDEAKQKGVKDWDNILSEKGISNIKIGIMVYVTADTSRRMAMPSGLPGAMPPPPGVQEPAAPAPSAPAPAPQRPAPKRDMSLIARFTDIMKGLPERLLEDESIKIAAELLANNDEDGFSQFHQKFIQNLRSNRQEIRLNAHTAYQKLLKAAPPGLALAGLVARTESIILGEIPLEKVSSVYNALFNSALKHAVYYLENKNYNGLKNVVTVVLKRLSDTKASDSTQRLTISTTSALRTQGGANFKLYSTLKENKNFPDFIRDLFHPDDEVKNAVRDILIAFNLVAVQDLINLIKETDDVSSREAIAAIINQMGNQAHQSFLNELKVLSDELPLKRFLGIAYLIPAEGMEQTLSEFIREPFYKETVNALARLNPDKSTTVLLPLLKDKNTDLVLSVLAVLGGLQYSKPALKSQASSAIISLLETSSAAEIQKESAKALVRMQEQKSIPAFAKMLSAKRFLGLVGGVSDEIRGTAAWALGQIKTPEAQAALESAANDKSPRVRSIVKLSLKNYEVAGK
ncbi:MAG: diguanylate cyclase [Planctomycetota bacterium]